MKNHSSYCVLKNFKQAVALNFSHSQNSEKNQPSRHPSLKTFRRVWIYIINETHFWDTISLRLRYRQVSIQYSETRKYQNTLLLLDCKSTYLNDENIYLRVIWWRTEEVNRFHRKVLVQRKKSKEQKM